MATIIGSMNGETLSGTNDDDTILGLGGPDTIAAGGGNDVIIAGAGGSDSIEGGAGTDTLVLGGPFADYTVDFAGSNLILTTGATVETVTGVETIAFGDRALTIVGAGSTLATVQEGVDATQSGGTVLVAPDTYLEGRNLVADKTLEIRGALAGVSPVGATTLWDSSQHTVIDSFGTTGTGGLVLDGLDLRGQTGNAGDPASAVQVLGTGGVTVRNSVLSATQFENTATGIEVGYVGGDVTVDNVVFQGFETDASTTGTYSGYGIYFNTDASVDRDISITNSVFDLRNGGDDDMRTYGVAFDGYGDGTGTLDISGNTFTDMSWGMLFWNSDGAAGASIPDYSGIQGNVFTNTNEAAGNINNLTDHVIETGANTSNGVAFDAFKVGTSSADEIIGSAGADLIAGNLGDDTLTGNGGNDKIYGGAGSDTAVFSGDFSDYAVDLSTGTVNGDDGTDTIVGVERLRFSSGEVIIVREGESIQEAIDAADVGDTILVAAGTFTENLVITEGISVIGAKRGVDGAGAGRGEGETIINGAIRIDADDVTLDGLQIAGSSDFGGLGLDLPVGLLIGGDGAVIRNTILQGDGRSGGSDVRPFSTFGGVQNLLFESNLVTHWAQGGYVVQGATGLFQGNHFLTNGNGIVTEASGVVISINDFRDSLGAHVALALFDDPIDASQIVLADNTHDFTRIATIYPNASAPVTIQGSELGDRLAGEFFTGPFSFDGGGGDDYAVGSGLNDTLGGGSGNDQIDAGDGNDQLDGGTGTDTLNGGTGDDAYVVDDAGDIVSELLGEGMDSVQTSLNSYRLTDYVENLTFSGAGNFTGVGNGLANTITGGAGNDVLNGGGGSDTMNGGVGDDRYVIQGNDLVIDASGNDRVESTAFNLDLNNPNFGGSIENARLLGSADLNLIGNSGGNTLIGNAGDNLIRGGSGQDFMTGGAGADIFDFNNKLDTRTDAQADRIIDFTQGEDFIDLLGIDARESSATINNAFIFIDDGAFTGREGELRFQINGNNTLVFGDTNGDRVADLRITLNGQHILNDGDFIL